MTASQLATDAGNGAVVLSGVTNAGKGGVYVQQVLPDQGARVVLPLPVGINDWNSSLSARTGASGVYVAYADGKGARLYRYGGSTLTLRSGSFVSAAVCAAPAGRLWVAWGDKVDGVFVTRSNMGVSAFEPVQRLKLAAEHDRWSHLPAVRRVDRPGGSLRRRVHRRRRWFLAHASPAALLIAGASAEIAGDADRTRRRRSRGRRLDQGGRQAGADRGERSGDARPAAGQLLGERDSPWLRVRFVAFPGSLMWRVRRSGESRRTIPPVISETWLCRDRNDRREGYRARGGRAISSPRRKHPPRSS